MCDHRRARIVSRVAKIVFNSSHFRSCTMSKTAKKATTKPAPKKKSSPAQDKSLSALDAAAQVLGSAAEPLNAKQLIQAMPAEGLWSSPGGKTPHATLFSALMREINTKGKESRFVKSERGKFVAN